MSTGTPVRSPRAVVVFGVAGSGKTTVASALAARIGADFVDADDHHDAARIAQMASGIPLRDADRWDWLMRLRAVIDGAAKEGRSIVLACSALRVSYRDVLREAATPLVFVGLDISRSALEERLSRRPAHFMPAVLLDSQLETYEPPDPAERDRDAFTVSAEQDVDAVVADILQEFERSGLGGHRN